MTRKYGKKIHCPRCNYEHTTEEAFGVWLRNNKKLSSKEGYCVVDQDYWIHQYKIRDDKYYQRILLLEVKTHGAKASLAQLDTLHAVNQVVRNRKDTPTKEKKWQAVGTTIVKVFSAFLNRHVRLGIYGVHTLTFSGAGPDDSDEITWDLKEIDMETLERILAFEIDPDTFTELPRSHHAKEEPRNEELPGLDVAR